MKKYMYSIALMLTIGHISLYSCYNHDDDWQNIPKPSNLSPLSLSTISNAKELVRDIQNIIKQELSFLQEENGQDESRKE